MFSQTSFRHCDRFLFGLMLQRMRVLHPPSWLGSIFSHVIHSMVVFLEGALFRPFSSKGCSMSLLRIMPCQWDVHGAQYVNSLRSSILITLLISLMSSLISRNINIGAAIYIFQSSPSLFEKYASSPPQDQCQEPSRACVLNNLLTTPSALSECAVLVCLFPLRLGCFTMKLEKPDRIMHFLTITSRTSSSFPCGLATNFPMSVQNLVYYMSPYLIREIFCLFVPSDNGESSAGQIRSMLVYMSSVSCPPQLFAHFSRNGSRLAIHLPLFLPPRLLLRA